MSDNQDSQLASETSTLAIVSLISGILSWFLFPLIGAIIAIITGHMARREIRDSQGGLTGDGMAIAGLVLGYIQLVLSLIGCCVLIVLLALGITTPFLCIPFLNEMGIWLTPIIGF